MLRQATYTTTRLGVYTSLIQWQTCVSLVLSASPPCASPLFCRHAPADVSLRATATRASRRRLPSRPSPVRLETGCDASEEKAVVKCCFQRSVFWARASVDGRELKDEESQLAWTETSCGVRRKWIAGRIELSREGAEGEDGEDGE